MLKMTLVTPTKRLLLGEEVEDVVVPGHRGELTILPGHAGLVTSLLPGVLRFRKKGSGVYSYAAISWGYCEVFSNHVNVLAETAELPKEIDVPRAQETLARANAKLANPSVTPEEIEKYSLKVQRAQVRLEVAQQKHLDS